VPGTARVGERERGDVRLGAKRQVREPAVLVLVEDGVDARGFDGGVGEAAPVEVVFVELREDGHVRSWQPTGLTELDMKPEWRTRSRLPS
jgi:hypothetical protein